MTVLKTAYQTTACRDYLMKKTTDALAIAMAHGFVNMVPASRGVYRVEGGSSVVDEVPAFAHPMLMPETGSPLSEEDPHAVVIDVRSFGKYDTHQASFVVRNAVEYKLMLYRAKLNHTWLATSPNILRDISPMPMAVFSSWVSEAISRRFALDPQEQLDLAILAAIWYNSQFTDAEVLTEREKLGLVSAVSRNLRIQASVVMEKMDTVPVITSMAHFCQLAAQATGSVRLQELSPGLMIAILGGTWSSNAREMIAVALEHPPTWIAILLQAVTERSYKNYAITKLTERNSHKSVAPDFVRCVLKLVDVAPSN